MVKKSKKFAVIFIAIAVIFVNFSYVMADKEVISDNCKSEIVSEEIRKILNESIVFYNGFYKVSVFSELKETKDKKCIIDDKVPAEFIKKQTNLKASDNGSLSIAEIAYNNEMHYFKSGNLILICKNELSDKIIEKNTVDIEKLFALFVAPEKFGGNGTIASPLNSINTAKKAAKKVLMEIGHLSDTYSVIFRGGDYSVSDTVNFTAEDNGTDKCKIIYESFYGENPIFDGGISVKGSEFKKVTDERVLSLCYPEVRNKIYQLQLKGATADTLKNLPSIQTYYNGFLMQIARWPNVGYHKTGKIIRNGNGTNGIEFCVEEEKIQRWKNAMFAYVYGFWVWEWNSDSHLVTKIDVEKNSIGTSTKPYYVPTAEGKDYYIYNLIEELDSQNEFYFDKSSAILYMIPYDSDVKSGSFNSVDIQIPLLNQVMLKLSNVENVEFRNLTFENSNVTLTEIENSKKCAVRGCTIRNAGYQGMYIYGMKTKDVVIDSCDIYKTGHTGIQAEVGDKQNLIPADLLITNCRIFDTSIIYRTNTPSIRLVGMGITASHNQLFNMPHIAFSFHGVQINFEYNEVFNTITDGAHDAGTMHNGRRMTNEDSAIRYNYFHDLNPTSLGVLYEDDHNPCHKIYGNIFYNTGRAVFIHGGRYNDVYNNIMIYPSKEDTPMIGFQTATPLTWDPVTMENINCDYAWGEDIRSIDATTPLWLERYPRMNEMMKTGYVVGPEHSKAYNNVAIYKSTVPDSFVTVATDIKEGTVDVHDNYATTKDIGFTNMKNNDFSLRDDAEIYNIIPGFKNPHFEKMGLYLNEYRTSFEERKAVNLVFPVNKQRDIEAREVTFKWSADKNTSRYKFELALDNSFKEIVRTEYTRSNYLTVKNLRYNVTRYYWRVYSCRQNELTDFEESMLPCKEGYSTFTTIIKENINTATAEEAVSGFEKFSKTVVEGNGSGEYFDGTKNMLNDLIKQFETLIKDKDKQLSQKKFDKAVTKLILQGNKIKSRRATEVITINNMLKDQASWTFQPNNVLFDNGISWIRHTNSDSTVLGYKTKKIETNQMLKFKARFDIKLPGQWQYFSMRSSQYDAEYSSMKTYIVIIKPQTQKLELQRYGTDKFLFKEYSCDAIIPGEDFEVEMGAIDMEDGSVNIIFKVNGTEYINYIDNDCQITDPGYFTVYMPNSNSSNTIHLMPIPEE